MKTRCYPLNSYHSGVEQQTTTESQEAIVQGTDGQRDAIVKVSEVHVKIESLEPDRRSSRSVTFENSAITTNPDENTQKSKFEKIKEVPV